MPLNKSKDYKETVPDQERTGIYASEKEGRQAAKRIMREQERARKAAGSKDITDIVSEAITGKKPR